MTRTEAIDLFCQEYVNLLGLKIPAKNVRFIVEGKTIETHNAFYLQDTSLRLCKT